MLDSEQAQNKTLAQTSEEKQNFQYLATNELSQNPPSERFVSLGRRRYLEPLVLTAVQLLLVRRLLGADEGGIFRPGWK